MNYDSLARELMRHVDGKTGTVAIDFANTHIVTMRRHDSDFRNLTACMDLFLPDGMPLVWVMNRQGAGLQDRVYGPAFTRRFLEAAPHRTTHYLIGGSQECGDKMIEHLQKKNPSLNVTGRYHGQASAQGILEDHDAVLADIQDKAPDFIWVGLGTPKQYAWISKVKPLLRSGVLLAVGFAFDVIAGTKPDAPGWMQRAGLTWLFRLLSEPGRLFGRYAKWNTLFILYLLAPNSKAHPLTRSK